MKLRLAFLWLLTALVGQGMAQTVSTIVRSTSPTSGPLEPYGVAADPDDNLYMTDPATQRIFRFRMSTGEYTVLAGKSGVADHVDGTLAQARFNDPHGIIYARGGLVVADSGNHSLRFIDLASGTVTTLAGTGVSGQLDGPGISAQFRLPRGLALDKLGNIYISDFRSKNIRRLDNANSVSTYATGFSGPSGIDMADDGRLFVADRAANLIRTVNTNGLVSTFAGSGAIGALDAEASLDASFSLPDGVIWLGTNFGLLITDSENHSLRRVFTDPEIGGYSVQTYAGLSGASGFADGVLTDARFNSPASLVRFSTGFLLVDELNRAVRQILVSPVPPRITDPAIGYIQVIVDPTSGSEVLKLFPVTDSIFNNEVTIGIRGEPNVRHLWTAGPGRTNVFDPDLLPKPDVNSPTAPEYFDGLPPSKRPATLTGQLPILSVKALSSAPGRTASGIVEATFRFQVATPSIDAVSAPGNITFLNSTTNAQMYYTLDGSDPSNVPGVNPATHGPILNSEKIGLVIGKSNLVVKARGYLDNFASSQTASATFSPTNFINNRISLGFSGGEASSEFVAAPGQRFYAPVTLTTLPNQKIYGMSFNLKVENLTGPAPAFNSDYSLSFTSSLKQKSGDTYQTITNSAYVGLLNSISSFQQVINNVTNTVFITNQVPVFTNLFSYDFAENLIGVGWLERAGSKNLYDTSSQDLISYSQPHDTIFSSKNRKVVMGAASFVVPGSAAIGDTYQMKLGRASGNSDGVSEDVLIEAPDGSDPTVPIKAVQTVTVASRHYLVGDVAPFRWFNAGDFGDNTIVNNDLEQLHQSVAYGLNLPPPGSDMLDAMDTCCVTTNITGFTTNLTIFTNLAIVTNIFVTNIVNLTTNFDVVNFADYLTNPIISTNFAFSTNLITTNLYEVLTNYVVTTNYLDAITYVLVTNLIDVVTNLVSSTNVQDITTNLTFVTNDIITTNLVTITNISGFTTNDFAVTNVAVLTNLVTTTNFFLAPTYLDAAGSFVVSDGNDRIVNQIGFGDGRLDVADLYVAFRRSLDPALVNYERYWSNGLLQSLAVSNLFRGNPLRVAGVVHAQAVDEGNGEPVSVAFSADGAVVSPGQVVDIPIRAVIKGGFPIRALLMRLKVESVDGNTQLTQPVSFAPSVEMGQPTQGGVEQNNIYAASWLDTSKAGIKDSAIVGVLRINIPTNASPNTAFLVHIEHMSGSPNGISVLPATTSDGLITMSARSAKPWNDGIPDAWRVQYFGSLLNMLSAPDADADGDGMSNMAEFKAGTNPTDFSSKLKLNSLHSDGVFTLRWPTGTNAVYSLESSPTLTTPEWTVLENSLIGTGEMMIYQPQLPDAPSRFYRIHLKD